jgi:hypothetical protein
MVRKNVLEEKDGMIIKGKSVIKSQTNIKGMESDNLPKNVTSTSSGRENYVFTKPINPSSNPLMISNDDVDLNKLFSSEIGSENDVLKELFTYDNIKTKTDLSRNDISIISRLELQAVITQNIYLKNVLMELEILRVSHGRLGRMEFVRSFGGSEEMKSSKFTERLANVFKDKV